MLAVMHEAAFSPAWDARAMLDLLQNGACAFIASDAGINIGFAMMRAAADEAELLSIVVSATEKRQGIGQKLMNGLCKQLEQSGVNTLFLEVASENHAGCRFYEKNGFSRMGIRKNYYANGDDAQTYRLALG
ncbi:MAG: ribosomal-protein-alanine N-acetyltransferase [Robiginitomaculum sp.]|nr:MAG: ribosomal-protein-alanine N-acetyltransferase [Robiginitomaculum sp.]